MHVILPYPDMTIATNKSHGGHWGKTSAKRKRMRQDAFFITKQANVSVADKTASVALRITFVQIDKRRRDLQNCLEAIKPSLDGFADALAVNDYQFDPITIGRKYGSTAYTLVEIIE